jgi:hypothetical protein
MLITLITTAIILLLCVVLLSVSILCRKDGKFPETHVGSNAALRKYGIRCAVAQHHEELLRKNLEERLKEINNII